MNSGLSFDLFSGQICLDHVSGEIFHLIIVPSNLSTGLMSSGAVKTASLAVQDTSDPGRASVLSNASAPARRET